MGVPGSPTPAPAAKAAPVFLALLVLLGVAFHGVFDYNDPYRCQALLDDGSWLHPPDEHGARQPFTNWQPHGCKLRQYTREDVHRCVEHRHMVFSGDSTTRQVFWAMARLLDRDAANEGRRTAEIHESYDMEFDGIRMLQIWNPYLKSGDDNPDLTRELDLFQREKHNPIPVNEQKSAALIFIGGGSWYSARFYHDDAIGNFTQVIDALTEILSTSDLQPFGSLIKPLDGVGSEVFVAPVAVPFYDELPSERTGPKGIHRGEIEDINAFLAGVADERRLPLLSSFPALSRNQPEAMVDRTDTGFHVIDSVAEIKATILLNARCNAKLHGVEGSPYDGTCCTDYGQRSSVQTVLLALGVFYVAACIFFELVDLLGRQSPAFFNMSAGIFVTALLGCHLADRTHLFSKGAKEFASIEFIILAVLVAAAGLVSISKLPNADDTPLSRDQTDEWKGWMQAAILIYHWTGASSNQGIYICLRLIVAAYLFQTGYGHTVFFLTKHDFSFKRVASIMLRLNLLSCALTYVMNTNYMLYYFAPLVSFWYMVVYATMALGSGYNQNTMALICKVVASALISSLVFLLTPLSEWLFVLLQTVFRIDWDLHEWQFRVCLDFLIVYVGMIAGIASMRTKRWTSLLMDTSFPGLLGLLVIGGYWYATDWFFDTKQDYNQWHPYISFIPVMAYMTARNVAKPVRIYVSRAFAWLGRCSLETFTLQFHLLLASDTKGVLLLGLSGDGSLLHDRWRDLVVIVPVFLWLSWQVAHATGDLVQTLTHQTEESKEQDLDEPLLGYNQFSNVEILQHMSSKSLANDLRIRVAGLLVLMWILNLLY